MAPAALLPLVFAFAFAPRAGGALAHPVARPITHVDTHEPAVAITFDACATKKGEYGFDREVFETLKREKVPATIFVSGLWADTHPDAMVELTGDPLIEFGDHSYDHPHMTKVTPARAGEEIDRTEAALARYGRHAVAFRPPFGEWNRRVVQIVRGKNLPTVTWDVVSGDPSRRTTTDGMIRNVLEGARPGSIIVFHINGRGWKTHEALPAILTGLRQRGFHFVPLSELLRTGGAPAGPPGAPAGPPGEAQQQPPPTTAAVP
jgi:peptidoglycan/xylan/chitin deacetylase (PgdA/CDA1 family)